jgi:hypothetical protein
MKKIIKNELIFIFSGIGLSLILLIVLTFFISIFFKETSLNQNNYALDICGYFLCFFFFQYLIRFIIFALKCLLKSKVNWENTKDTAVII